MDKTRITPLGDRDSRVLGFFAYAGPGEVFGFEDACLIAGSRERLRACLETRPDLARASFTFAKIRFADVHAGLDSGAAYVFDEEAFGRFAPLARAAGIDVAETFPEPEPVSPEPIDPGAISPETINFVKVVLASPERP